MHMHSPNKQKKFKQTLSARKLMTSFLGQQRSADGGIHATRGHNNVSRVLRNTKKLRRDIQNKKRGMLTSGVVLLLDNECPHTAARTQVLDDFNWELFDHHPYSPDPAPSDYYLFTYQKN
jgi:hypothetical protein